MAPYREPAGRALPPTAPTLAADPDAAAPAPHDSPAGERQRPGTPRGSGPLIVGRLTRPSGRSLPAGELGPQGGERLVAGQRATGGVGRLGLATAGVVATGSGLGVGLAGR